MAAPPLSPGVNETERFWLPGVMDTPVGAAGVVAEEDVVTAALPLDHAESPPALTAFTRK